MFYILIFTFLHTRREEKNDVKRTNNESPVIIDTSTRIKDGVNNVCTCYCHDNISILFTSSHNPEEQHRHFPRHENLKYHLDKPLALSGIRIPVCRSVGGNNVVFGSVKTLNEKNKVRPTMLLPKQTQTNRKETHF
jgi:hypothetical protein